MYALCMRVGCRRERVSCVRAMCVCVCVLCLLRVCGAKAQKSAGSISAEPLLA